MKGPDNVLHLQVIRTDNSSKDFDMSEHLPRPSVKKERKMKLGY